METDELLRGLGVTARGERDVAREVIEDAAARAAEAEATARAKKRCNERDDDLPAASANATTTDDGGEGEGQRGGDGPALREVSRLRTEADGVARELLAVRDALDEIRASERDGTAPSDAALVVAVGNRRVTSLEEKRAEPAEASAAEEASAAAAAAAAAAERRGRGTDATAASGSGSKTKKKKKKPNAAAALVEDGDLDALLDAEEGGGDGGRLGETERERLIRTGVITPFAAVDGFERRVKVQQTTDAAAGAVAAWKAGRSKSKLLTGDAVPKQYPAARPFNASNRQGAGGGEGAKEAARRMASKRREWRRNMNGEGGEAPKRRRKRRQRDAAYSSDEDVEIIEDEVEEEDDEEEEDGVEAPREVEMAPPENGAADAKEEEKDAAVVAGGGGGGGKWSCPGCTFANSTRARRCEMCETPKPVVPKREPADDDDDDVVFVGEVAAAEGGARERARGKREKPATATATATATRASPRAKPKPAPRPSTAPPPPRRAAETARARARGTAAAEADDISGTDTGESDWDGDGSDDADGGSDDDDDDVEPESPEDLEEIAPPARGRGRGRRRASDAAAAAPRGRRRAAAAAAARQNRRREANRPAREEEEEEDEEEEEEEEEVIFDGGLRLPAETYDRLLEHQKTSIKWLWEIHCQRAGGVVGDEMGLGKTVQVAAFLCALERSGLYQPTLIVCPATMLRQWRRELRAWAPKLNCGILHESAVSAASRAAARGSKKQARCNIIRERVRDPKGVLLTTYEHLRVMRDHLLPVRWGYAILDEGHKIRNPDADVTICAKQLQTVHRLVMTGAPIQNRLAELWSLFDFCFPGKLGTLPVFQAQFAVPIQVGGYSNASQQQVTTAYRCASMLKELISPYLLRRMKADVDIQLPTKTEQVLFCPMTQEQREAYRAYVHSRDVEEILEGRREALGGIDVLRKIVNHPDLLERRTKAAHEKYGEVERSGKQLVTQKVLELWKEQGHRVLLFSQTQQMLDILEAMVAKAGYPYRRMDGATPVSQRMTLIDEFNTDANVFVFLLTTKVGGLGVNLTGADRVLLYDPDWNPSTDAQARERAWRIGQTREVTVYRLVTAGTIEEKVYHRQIYKEFLTSKVLKDPKQRRFFKAKDLADLFTWEEDNHGQGVGGDGQIETAELFAEVEGEIRAADVAEAEDDEDEDEDEDDGGVGGLTAKDIDGASPESADDTAWDIDADPAAAAAAARKAAKSKPGGKRFTIATDRSAGARAAQTGGDGDAAIMRSLFGGGGGGGGTGAEGAAGEPSTGAGLIRGAMSHDAIMRAPNGRDHLVGGGGSAALEADRVARRAEEALRQSRVARGSAGVAVPTWTGRSGAAGAPVGAVSAASARRFGRSVPGVGVGGGGGRFGSGGGGGGGAGIAGIGQGAMGSQTLLQRIRQRDAAAGEAAAAAAAGADFDEGDDDAEAETLLREIVDFLRARPSGRAPTGLVVDAFQHRVSSRRTQMFRRLLKTAAALERNPPDANGRGGGATWCLKDEFKDA